MKLLIVESPSKAKTINQYLGKEYVVLSSYGHVRALPSEEGAVQPNSDFILHYKVLPKSKKQLDQIIAKYKECDELYLATDPDREGEAIAWHILEAIKEKKIKGGLKPVKRVVFHEITKKAILEAMEHPRDINNDLVHAQQARQAMDYLVGFNLSPVLWRKLPGSKAAGRVQSVALRLICDREAEIEVFKSDEYWSIEANFQRTSKEIFLSKLVEFDSNKLDKMDIKNGDQASTIEAALLKKSYSVTSIEKKEVARHTAAPFTTSTLLQDAGRKLGFSAKKTAKIAQDLYEGQNVGGKIIGLITYMRTDSVSISQEALFATRGYIGSAFGAPYLPEKPKFYKNRTKNAQEAHEAIRPTDVTITPASLKGKIDDDHFRLYDLIWKRLVASQMSSALFDSLTVDVSAKDSSARFRTTGSTLKFDGFLKLYQDSRDEDVSGDAQILPQFAMNEQVDLQEIMKNQHFTQPPPRYTEANLVKKMEELGIGRPSTYPAIISILSERGYVKIEKKRFYAESRGRLVSSFLTSYFPQYVEYGFTAGLEDALDDVSNGEKAWKSLLSEFWVPFHGRVQEVLTVKIADVLQSLQENLKHMLFDKKESLECPDCKKGRLELRLGKFGAFIGCSDYPNCKHIERLDTSAEQGEEAASASQNLGLPKVLGENDGKEVSIRSGPYGVYLQLGDGKDVKRAKIPAGRDIASITLEYANSLLELPKVIGEFEGIKVTAGFGRFGPYIEHNKKYYSIKGKDPAAIEIDDAIVIIKAKKDAPPATRGRFKKGAKKDADN
ncbi:MAG: type I DNA topoisomerase [Candidatus Jidaibacter sp.]|jgi:DNA topoisomerase-1|nr:type I DNA topoisomerase [Candidatus Jidaibacter sp.]